LVFHTLLTLGHTLLAQGDIVGTEVRLCEGLALIREVRMLTLIKIGPDGLAIVAAAKGQPFWAAWLWGATEALRKVTEERRWHIFQRPLRSRTRGCPDASIGDGVGDHLGHRAYTDSSGGAG
jgi:hypothetical protein